MRSPEPPLQNLSESIRLAVCFVACGLVYCWFDEIHVRSYLFRVIYLSLVVGAAIRRST